MSEVIGTQRYRVLIEFEYESEVYDDDPVDVFQLAELEQQAFEDSTSLLVDALYTADIDTTINVTALDFVE